MYIFWKNITRYPTFFVTSVSGLIVIILTPLLKILKKDIQSFFLVIFTIGLLVSLIWFILTKMLDL